MILIFSPTLKHIIKRKTRIIPTRINNTLKNSQNNDREDGHPLH
jgi:hypothetical protein